MRMAWIRCLLPLFIRGSVKDGCIKLENENRRCRMESFYKKKFCTCLWMTLTVFGEGFLGCKHSIITCCWIFTHGVAATSNKSFSVLLFFQVLTATSSTHWLTLLTGISQ